MSCRQWGRADESPASCYVARRLAPDTTSALRTTRGRPPVTTPTRSDLAFLAALAPALPTLHPPAPARARVEPAELRVV
jgi:hypothetical protein